MAALVANNASTLIASALAVGAASVGVTGGTGDLFPLVDEANDGNWFLVTLTKADTSEIVRCTKRIAGSDGLTIVRAQEGTTALAFDVGDSVELRLTAETINSFSTVALGTSATTAAKGDHTHTAPTWNSVTGKPTTFAPDLTGIAPALTGSLTKSEDADGVQLSWAKSADTVDFYEVWSSVTESDEYVLIGKVLSGDVSTSTVEMTDDGYDTSSTTVYYKVFAVNKGSYSNALSANITVSNTVLDPTNLIVVPVTGAYMVQYDLPNDPKLANVTIKKYAATTEAGANNEGAATAIYTGERDTFIYEVPSADATKYHKFWVSSNTRT